MIDWLFNIANIVLATSIFGSLYMRIKYRRFGNISRSWERTGWLLMILVVSLVLGDSARTLTSQKTEINNFKETRIVFAAYFLWYAITLFWVTRKQQPSLKDPQKLETL